MSRLEKDNENKFLYYLGVVVGVIIVQLILHRDIVSALIKALLQHQ